MRTSTPSIPKVLRVIPFLAVASVGYVLFAPAAVPEVLIRRFGIGYTAFGLLTSAPLFSFVLAQAPSSYLTARYSTTRILLAATAFHVVLALALDFATSFLTLLFLRTVWGLAAGTILTVGATHIARLQPGENTTRQQGIYGGVLTLGGAIAFVSTPLLLSAVEFGGLHSPGAVFGIFAVAACWRYRNEAVTAPRPQYASTADTSESSNLNPSSSENSVMTEKRTTESDVRQILTHPAVVVAALCYVATLGSYVTLSTFITAYFDTLGVSGPLNVLVLLVATTGRAVGGVVTRRWKLRDWTAITAATATAVVGFGVLVFGRSLAVVVIFPLVVMFAVSFPFGAIYGVAADTAVGEGVALAVVIAAGNLAALLLPALTGAIRDVTGGYRGGFLLLGVLNAVAVVGIVLLQRLDNPRSST